MALWCYLTTYLVSFFLQTLWTIICSSGALINITLSTTVIFWAFPREVDPGLRATPRSWSSCSRFQNYRIPCCLIFDSIVVWFPWLRFIYSLLHLIHSSIMSVSPTTMLESHNVLTNIDNMHVLSNTYTHTHTHTHTHVHAYAFKRSLNVSLICNLWWLHDSEKSAYSMCSLPTCYHIISETDIISPCTLVNLSKFYHTIQCNICIQNNEL